MAIEIVDFPMKNGWIFHCYVSSPEGKQNQVWNPPIRSFCLCPKLQLQIIQIHPHQISIRQKNRTGPPSFDPYVSPRNSSLRNFLKTSPVLATPSSRFGGRNSVAAGGWRARTWTPSIKASPFWWVIKMVKTTKWIKMEGSCRFVSLGLPTLLSFYTRQIMIIHKPES